ncbi:hypothetical protein D3C75_701070 [compost metagenome]
MGREWLQRAVNIRIVQAALNHLTVHLDVIPFRTGYHIPGHGNFTARGLALYIVRDTRCGRVHNQLSPAPRSKRIARPHSVRMLGVQSQA